MGLLPDADAHDAAVDAAKRSVFEMTDFAIDHTPFEENVSFLVFNDAGDGWGASVRVISVTDGFTVTDADAETEGIFALVLNPESETPRICIMNGPELANLKHRYAGSLPTDTGSARVALNNRIAQALLDEFEATPERWRELLHTDYK